MLIMKYFSFLFVIIGMSLLMSCGDESESDGGSVFSELIFCEDDNAEFLYNGSLIQTMHNTDGSDILNPEGVSCGIAAALEEANEMITLRIESEGHKLLVQTRVNNLNENVVYSDFTNISYASDAFDNSVQDLLPDHPNNLTITEFDAELKTISGEFNLGFASPIASTMITLTDGKFTCTYQGF